MGIIVREATAPILNREVASGDEVEAEFDKLFGLIGETGGQGAIDDANIAQGANIAGSQLLDTSVPGSAFIDDTIGKDKFARAMRVFQANDASTVELNATTSFEDEGISLALTGLTSGDWIDVTFTGLIRSELWAQNVQPTDHWFTFSLDTVDQDVLARSRSSSSNSTYRWSTVKVHFPFQATADTHDLVLRSRVEEIELPSTVADPPEWSNNTPTSGGSAIEIVIPRTMVAIVIPQKL